MTTVTITFITIQRPHNDGGIAGNVLGGVGQLPGENVLTAVACLHEARCYAGHLHIHHYFWWLRVAAHRGYYI